ncbi:hypothetical protein G7Z17_g11541 [Cylindrodendrum hubeiense]|uniref:Uncharacterized protein n=1 Tax=Cylindrodendrum hubeiense TaxID=595255 RepID=A0A9P5L3V3_9HYPO|nr:hypothetical protein G7Z17_g11541 [Cylindrodendrum hubeiense]
MRFSGQHVPPEGTSRHLDAQTYEADRPALAMTMEWSNACPATLSLLSAPPLSSSSAPPRPLVSSQFLALSAPDASVPTSAAHPLLSPPPLLGLWGSAQCHGQSFTPDFGFRTGRHTQAPLAPDVRITYLSRPSPRSSDCATPNSGLLLSRRRSDSRSRPPRMTPARLQRDVRMITV